MIHKIGTYDIPLDPKISFPLVMRSPLFDNSDGKTPGSFIFNTRQPATPQMRAAFEQGHRATRNGRATSEQTYFFQTGSLRFSGTCSLQQADDKYYEVRYNIRNGDFAAEAAKKTLKDLDLGGDRSFSTSPYSIGSGSNDLAVLLHDDLYPVASEINIPITNVFVDFTGSFPVSDPATFTTPDDGTYYFDSTINLVTVAGSAWLMIYKNAVLLEQIALVSGINMIEQELTLLENDIITFKLDTYSEPVNDGYEINLYIEANYILALRTDGSLFVDAALADQDTFDYTVFPVENPNFFDNFPQDDFQIDNINIGHVYAESFFVQNYWKNNHFPYMLSGNKNDIHTYAMNIFTPFVYVKYLLEKIASLFNYELVDSPFVTGSLYFNAVLFNAFGENTYTIDDASMINVKPTFNLVDHVPETPITTFLNALGKFTGRRIDIDTEVRTITFVRLRSVIESTASVPFPGVITEAPLVTVEPEYKGFKIELKASADKYISERVKVVNPKHVYKGSVTHLNNLPATGNTVNDIYLVTALNEFYVWKYSTSVYRLAWGFHSRNFYLTRQQGEEPFLQISGDMAPILDQRVVDETVGAPANRTWIVPVTWQAGNFEGYPDMSAEYGLQFMLYKGLKYDSNSELYPLAVSGTKDYAGTTFTNPNLCLDGITPNLYTDELEAWLQWLVFNAKPVKLKAVLTPAQLRAIRFSNKYRILGTNYLIKEIRVNILNDHLSEAEIEAYTC